MQEHRSPTAAMASDTGSPAFSTGKSPDGRASLGLVCLRQPDDRAFPDKTLTAWAVSSEEEALFPDSPTSPAADDSPMAGGVPAAAAGGAGHQWLQD